MHEVQIPYDKTRLEERHKSYLWLRQVLALPRQEKILVGFEVPTGSVYSGYKIILDAHPQRQFTNGRIRGQSPADGEELFQRLAHVGKPSREPFTDPVLWLFRIWWAVRQATLALSDLQPHEKLSRTLEIPKGIAPSPLTYSAMAARAFQCSGVQYGNSELCDGLLDRLHAFKTGEPRPGPCPVPDNTTGNRLLWLETSRTHSREEAWDNLCAAGIFRNQRPQIPSRSVDQEHVPGTVQKIRGPVSTGGFAERSLGNAPDRGRPDTPANPEVGRKKTGEGRT